MPESGYVVTEELLSLTNFEVNTPIVVFLIVHFTIYDCLIDICDHIYIRIWKITEQFLQFTSMFIFSMNTGMSRQVKSYPPVPKYLREL